MLLPVTLESKWPVQENAVSRATYPVPMNNAMAEAEIRPIEAGVPSSISWKPTSAFKRRIQQVAVIAAMWTAENP